MGEHIKKARIEKGLFQKDVAIILNVSEDCVTYWENGRSKPQVRHYPAIIAFVGYYPFRHETDTIGGKLRQIRYSNGHDFERLARALSISVDAAKRWENGKLVMNPRLKALIVSLWEHLQFPPNYPTLQLPS